MKEFQKTAHRLALIFNNENANEVIDDVLKDIIIEMENESQVSSYHPEVIKTVYPLMIEEMGERGKIFDYVIRTILDNHFADLDMVYYDAPTQTDALDLSKLQKQRLA